MRPRLIEMLRALDFETLLGISEVARLWGSEGHLMHATSVVPHAAFLRGVRFAGSFEDVLASRVFRKSFERDFAASLPLISTDALYVALGKTPMDALDWCVGQGLLRHRQVQGALAHPSSAGGSRVDVYLGARLPGDLKARDPVRRSAEWLVAAAKAMRLAMTSRGCSPKTLSRKAVGPVSALPARPAAAAAAPIRPSVGVRSGSISGLYAIIPRGKNKGAVLRPQVIDGCYILSSDKYGSNHFPVPVGTSLKSFFEKGFGLRMAGPPGHSASFIIPASIYGRSGA